MWEKLVLRNALLRRRIATEHCRPYAYVWWGNKQVDIDVGKAWQQVDIHVSKVCQQFDIHVSNLDNRLIFMSVKLGNKLNSCWQSLATG